LISTWLILGK